MTHPARQSGFMLLEMVIAVGLLVLGMALIGAQISTSTDTARETELMSRVVFLAESKIAELDTGLIIPEEEIEEDFGRLFPEFGWRMRIVPAAETELNLITLEILYEFAREPDEEFDFEDAEVMQTYHTLRATPTSLDMTRDFGLEEEQADDINNQLADLTGGAVDVREFDPSIFQNLSPEELAGLAEMLINQMGADASALMQLLPPQARGMLQPFLEDLQGALDDGSGDTGDDGAANPVGDGSEGDSAPPGDPSDGGGQPGNDSGGGDSAQDGDDSNRPPRGERERGGERGRGGGRRGNSRGGGPGATP